MLYTDVSDVSVIMLWLVLYIDVSYNVMARVMCCASTQMCHRCVSFNVMVHD